MKTKLLWLMLAGITCTAQAAEDDFTQQILIQADNNLTSIKDNISTYLNNVEIRQGSLLIKADKLEANASAGKGNEVFIALGNPASYSQILNDDEAPVTATATEIRYDLATRTLTLSGNASLTQSGSMVQGAVIRYNIEKQELTAESGDDNSRVTTIFTPEGKKNP
ncbi:lipopolysaccharide transport periplasmic protein LptA [Chromatiaceae bacterium AAb-1]|nr:lipopolysaccharide transport periplasmic protein LptA [Chromatiaceae bacterium AAb-1]